MKCPATVSSSPPRRPRLFAVILTIGLAWAEGGCEKEVTQLEACQRVAVIACERVSQCGLASSSGFQGYDGSTTAACIENAQKRCAQAVPPCTFVPANTDSCEDKIAEVSCNNLGTAIGSCQTCR